MEKVQTTDTQNEANSNNEVALNDVAESESLLGQNTEEKGENNNIVNPLTDKIEKEQEEAKNPNKEDVQKVNFDNIKLPEGKELDQELIKEFSPLVKEIGLTQEQTQKLIDLQMKGHQKAEEANVNQFKETVENLQKETKEMLGANYEKELAFAAKAINLLPKEEQTELREVLNVSGIGNHPLLVKMFIAAGKALSEDKFVGGEKTKIEKSAAEVLFG